MKANRKGRATPVDGVIVRSMLEASWLKFFNLLKVPVEYEPERFPDTISTIGYLPDFYLKSGIYIEIKPTYEVFLKEKDKPIGFVKATGKDLLLIIGKPPGRQVFAVHKNPDGKVKTNMIGDNFCWSENPSVAVKQRERAVAKRSVDYAKDKNDISTWIMRAMSCNP